MWQKATVDIGEHAAKYAGFVLTALGKRICRPQVPQDESECAGLILGVTGVASTLVEDLVMDRSLPRVVVGVCRMVHESVVLLGRLGLTKEQVNAVLSAALDDEMCRVDPDKGFLEENAGKPYMAGGAILDPPDFAPFWLDGISRKLRDVGISTDMVDDE